MEIKNYFAQDAQGNIMPSANCYLYFPGTTTLATGLVDGNGAPISNPFLASSIGQVTFGAPNGVYDLRISQGARDTTIEIQCADLLQALNETASFLGAHSTPPTSGNSGEPLQIYYRYFNTVDQLEYLYKSTGWVANNLDGQLLATSQGASLLGAVMKDGSSGTIQDAINYGDTILRQQLADPLVGPTLVAAERSTLAEAVSWWTLILSLSPGNPREKAYSSLIVSKPILADDTTWDWAPAITACCAANRSVVVTERFNVVSTVTITPAQVILGRDNLSCGFNYKSSGYLFELLTANGTAEIAGPQLKNMKLTGVAGSKILRLNSKTGGFTDNASSQCYIMRPLVEDCVIEGSGTGAGIEWNKCFNGVVNRTKIQGFDTALDLMGCDSISITGQSRMVANGVHVRAKSAGTFGSGLNLGNVEMLAASDNLVVSDYRDFILDDSYLEQTFALSTGVAFDITGGLHFSMWANRIEIPASAAPTLTKVTGDFFMYRKGANKNSGPAWGADVWNAGAGALFWKNALNRQKIIVDPNASESGPPFATLPTLLNRPARFKSAWEMSPSVTSLSNSDQGVSVRVKNNAFVFPYNMTAQYSFSDANKVVTGNVNIYLKAYSSVDGLSLTVQRRNGSTAISTIQQVLTTVPAWYQLYSNVSATDLRMYFLNRDAATSGDTFVECLVVDYV